MPFALERRAPATPSTPAVPATRTIRANAHLSQEGAAMGSALGKVRRERDPALSGRGRQHDGPAREFCGRAVVHFRVTPWLDGYGPRLGRRAASLTWPLVGAGICAAQAAVLLVAIFFGNGDAECEVVLPPGGDIEINCAECRVLVRRVRGRASRGMH